MEKFSGLLEAIYGESREAAERILENSRKSAAEMKLSYEKEAQAAKKSIMADAEKYAGEIRQRNISQAGIESRNIKLMARRKALREAFDSAEEKLAGLSWQQKRKMYEKLISEYSTGREVTVQLSEDDKKLLGNKLKVEGIRIRIDDQAGDFTGGLIIREDDIETNCTFEVIIDSIRRDMEPEVAAILFS